MEDKVSKIVNFLSKRQEYVSVHSISANCEMSVRSVYSYLDILKKDSRYQIETGRKGVRLILIKADESSNHIPATFRERKDFILRKILIQFKELDISDLIEYFCISEATFHTELIRIRHEISTYKVKIITKNNRLFIEAEDENRRKLILHLIYHDGQNGISPVSMNRLQAMFADFDVELIRKIIIQEIENSNNFIDEYSVMNLLLHILLTASQRIHEESSVNYIAACDDYHISPMIETICECISKRYDVKFHPAEKELFSIMLNTRMITEHVDFDTGKVKHKEVIALASLVIEKLYITFNLNLNVPNFKYPFIFHLDNLMERLFSNVHLNNPLLKNIKLYSPITYDIAIYASKIIAANCRQILSESEIAYIALHLGVQIEEARNSQTRLKTIIVCPQYFTYRQCKLREISDKYRDDLYVLNAYTSEEQIPSFEDVDLVISTISIHQAKLRHITIHVSDFFHAADRATLHAFIAHRKQTLYQNQNKETLENVFDESLFFRDLEFASKEDAINFMADNMKAHEIVRDGYKKAVFEREEIAPTDFNNVAIPHPVEAFAKNTKFSIALLKRPISWRPNTEATIYIIFMIAFNDSEFPIFENIFTAVTRLCTDGEKTRKVLECKNYQEFISTLLTLFNMQ